MSASSAGSPPPTSLDSPRTITEFNTTLVSTTTMSSSFTTAATPSGSASDVKVVSFDIPSSGDSDTSQPESGEITEAELAQLVEALQSNKDRIWLLRIGESMERLISQQGRKIDFQPVTTYQRMLVHRCASFYKLQPETDSLTKVITLTVTPASKVPKTRLSELVPNEETPQITFQIMRRGGGEKRTLLRHGSTDDSDSVSETGSSGTGRTQRMSIAEREAAYNEARSRIFMDFESNKSGPSASSSTLSLPQTLALNTPSPAPSEGAGPASSLKRQRSNIDHRDVVTQSPTPPEYVATYEDQATDDDVEGRHEVSYPTLYNPQSGQTEPVQPAYPMYPQYLQPVAIPYPYPFGTGYAYQPAYGPPMAPGPAPMYYAGNPYLPQQGPFMWVAPPVQAPPVQAPQAAPTMTEQGQPEGLPYMQQYYPQMPQMPGMQQPMQQLMQQPMQPPMQQPVQQQMQHMPAMQPVRSTYPPAGPSQSHLPYQHANNSDTAMNTRSFRGASSTMHHTNGRNSNPHTYNNGAGGGRGNNGNSITRNAWSFGPGISQHQTFERSRMGTGSVSGMSNGSGSGSGSRTPLDDASSTVSSSTSSSSRATYTSVGSGRHPLPPRPDWAVGLAPSNERRPSPAMQAPPRPQDFPPLNGGRVAAPQKVGGAWSGGSKAVINAAQADSSHHHTPGGSGASTSGGLVSSPRSVPTSPRFDEPSHEQPASRSAELFDPNRPRRGILPRQTTPTQNIPRSSPGVLQNSPSADAAMIEAMTKLKLGERASDVSLTGSAVMEQEAAASPASVIV